MSKFLVAQDMVKDYRQGATTLRVLHGVSLSVREGEFLVIVGASGAGKSTLLHLLGLLDTPTSGQLFFSDERLSSLSGRAQSRRRNLLFGFVFQFFHLLPDFTATENVMLPSMVSSSVLGWGHRKAAARARAESLLDRVGLKDRMLHRPTQLSGGERQRVAFCRALMNDPRVLLLDEPTGNLDSKTGAEIHSLIHDLNQSGQTVIMVTHDEDAARRADRIVRIRDGRIVS